MGDAGFQVSGHADTRNALARKQLFFPIPWPVALPMICEESADIATAVQQFRPPRFGRSPRSIQPSRHFGRIGTVDDLQPCGEHSARSGQDRESCSAVRSSVASLSMHRPVAPALSPRRTAAPIDAWSLGQPRAVVARHGLHSRPGPSAGRPCRCCMCRARREAALTREDDRGLFGM
jgi:hypothetical protein